LSTLKKLAGQTAIYGLSTIVGKLLNYLLTPILTRVFSPAEYGVNAELFVYASFLAIVFTYGMETTYFRYATKEADKTKVFDTAFLTVFATTVIITGSIIACAQPIANWLQYPTHPEYVIWFALILGFDAFVAIPFAQLRIENRPLKFAFFRLTNIGINILLTLFFVAFCPYVLHHDSMAAFLPFVNAIYNPTIGVGYIFISTMVANGITWLLMLPHVVKRSYQWSAALLKQMLPYALPMLIVGTAGMINETLDRRLLKVLLPLPLHEKMAQIGIYSACYKLSIVMTLFVQAYRMAAEPFFFSQAKQLNPQQVYADSMKYFMIVCSFIFLGVMVFLDMLKGFLGSAFHEGLHIVPILLLANLCLGAYYNLSIWYKLTEQTRMGAYISIIGAIITLLLNYIWIPVYGYTGSAWATLLCYAAMMLLSYLMGQRHYPVPYKVGRMLSYIAFSVLLWQITVFVKPLIPQSSICFFMLNSLSLLVFAGIAYKIESVKK
jgi:O-antigen/teichoic acid export membrane protein